MRASNLKNYLKRLLVAKDSFSRWALDPIAKPSFALTCSGSVIRSHWMISFNADSNLTKSSNLDAPSASANNMVAPLAFCIPCGTKGNQFYEFTSFRPLFHLHGIKK